MRVGACSKIYSNTDFLNMQFTPLNLEFWNYWDMRKFLKAMSWLHYGLEMPSSLVEKRSFAYQVLRYLRIFKYLDQVCIKQVYCQNYIKPMWHTCFQKQKFWNKLLIHDNLKNIFSFKSQYCSQVLGLRDQLACLSNYHIP